MQSAMIPSTPHSTRNSTLRMAVIGVGHLGKEHARILSTMSQVKLVGVVDTSLEQATMVAEKCGTKAFNHFADLYDRVDAVTVVVPTVYHHRVAKEFLARGIPTFVEKPIATTLQEADDLIAIASKAKAPIQIGHIERFNPAFEELIGRPIQPKFVEIERHGPFTGRSTDIGAVLDLMIHDLDLLLALNGDEVSSVSAVGAAVFGGHEDFVNARIQFVNGCTAHVTASRVSPKPKRRLRIWAPEGYAGIDFVQKSLVLVQPSEELRKNGLQLSHLDPARRANLKNEIFHRHLQTLELDCRKPVDQLTCELKDFVDCILKKRSPRVTGVAGRAALALAHRVLDNFKEHRWEGGYGNVVGPDNWPVPLGPLFEAEFNSNQDRHAA